jgi:mRNA-degrading endonuclease YafQ of YafQ-DinJ toxin-antitoxin module
MRIVISSIGFKRAFKRRCKNRPQLQVKVRKTLALLEFDPFFPSLKTHKLEGKLKDSWACSVEYDFRIVFQFYPSEDGTAEEAILLVDIGTHDEVYE